MTSEFRDFARVFGSGLLESSHFANGGHVINCVCYHHHAARYDEHLVMLLPNVERVSERRLSDCF
jgi:hypothetical protein